MSANFHIGKLLTKLIEEKKYKRSDITRMVGVQNSAFYGYEMRYSLQCYVVWKLCYAMKYNIFLDLANTLPPDFDYDKTKPNTKEQLLEQLQEENKKLKWENDLLKEMIIKKG
jgi:hypothetical protein